MNQSPSKPAGRVAEAGCDGMVTCALKGWTRFKSSLFDVIRKEQSKYGYDISGHKPSFLFRGQSCASWPLWSSFDRLAHNSGVGSARVEEIYNNMLRSYFNNGVEIEAFTEAVSFRTASDYDLIAANPKLKSDLEAYAQHHKLPTRLLDWSQSPYIAAFFAAADSDKCESNEIAIWCLDVAAAKVLLSELELYIHNRRPNSGRRQTWQRAAFTINRTNILETDQIFLNECGRLRETPRFPALFKVTLPRKAVAEILNDLDMMRINYLSIFPDIDGLTQFVRHELEQELKER